MSITAVEKDYSGIYKGDTFGPHPIEITSSSGLNLSGATLKIEYWREGGAVSEISPAVQYDVETGALSSTFEIDKVTTALVGPGDFKYRNILLLSTGEQYTFIEGRFSIKEPNQ